MVFQAGGLHLSGHEEKKKKKEMYLSRGPPAAGPRLCGSNVNGGLGDVGWDPHPTHTHTTFSTSLQPLPPPPPPPFSIKTAGVFQRVLPQ